MADLSKLFEKAEEATNRRSYDLAIDQYRQVLVLDPDSEKARYALREVEVRKADEFGSPSKVLTGLAAVPNLVMAQIYSWVKKHDLATFEYEKILARDPKNGPISFRLGRALEASGLHKGALAVFRGITLWDEQNVEAFVAAGHAARRTGKIEEALDFYEKARALNPKHKIAVDAVRDLSAMLSLKPREKASSFRDLIKSPAAPSSGGAGEEAGEEAGDDLSQLKARLEKDPADRETAMKLADRLEAKGDLKNLLGALKKAVQARPSDAGLKRRLMEANVKAMEAKLRRIEKGGKTSPESDTLRKKLADAKKKLLQAQVEEDPSRLDLKLDLGLLLFEAGEIDEAIGFFQQVKKDPKKKREASFWLGRGFMEKGKHNLAVNQLQAAMPAGSNLDAWGKETLYYLGKAKVQAGDPGGARQHFERIYEEDIHFRDVAGILEELG